MREKRRDAASTGIEASSPLCRTRKKQGGQSGLDRFGPGIPELLLGIVSLTFGACEAVRRARKSRAGARGSLGVAFVAIRESSRLCRPRKKQGWQSWLDDSRSLGRVEAASCRLLGFVIAAKRRISFHFEPRATRRAKSGETSLLQDSNSPANFAVLEKKRTAKRARSSTLGSPSSCSGFDREVRFDPWNSTPFETPELELGDPRV